MSGTVFGDNDDNEVEEEDDVATSADEDRDVFVTGLVDMFDDKGRGVSVGGDVDVDFAGMAAPVDEVTEQQCVLIIHKKKGFSTHFQMSNVFTMLSTTSMKG